MAAPQKKVIVTCAITGGIHTPNLEIATPDDTRVMLQLKGQNAVAF